MNEPERAPGPVMPSRKELREALLDKKRTSGDARMLTLFGLEVEVRTPALRDIMSVREIKDPAEQAARMITKYVYVPGTDERVFEEADIPDIMGWAFGKEVTALQNAISDLTGLDIDDEKRELAQDPLGGKSSS